EHLVNLLDEALGSERLEDDRCAELQPVLHFGELPLALDDSEARHVENAEIRPLQPEQQRQILAARAGHHDGGHQEVDRAVMRRGNAHRLLGVERVQDLVALLFEHFAGRGKDIGLVVHQQNSFHKWPPTAATARIHPAYQDSTGRRESLTPLEPCLSFRLLPWSRAEASSHAICRKTSPAFSPMSSTPPAKPSPTTSCQWCSTAARRRARFVPPPTSTGSSCSARSIGARPPGSAALCRWRARRSSSRRCSSRATRSTGRRVRSPRSLPTSSGATESCSVRIPLARSRFPAQHS